MCVTCWFLQFVDKFNTFIFLGFVFDAFTYTFLFFFPNHTTILSPPHPIFIAYLFYHHFFQVTDLIQLLVYFHTELCCRSLPDIQRKLHFEFFFFFFNCPFIWLFCYLMHKIFIFNFTQYRPNWKYTICIKINLFTLD